MESQTQQPTMASMVAHRVEVAPDADADATPTAVNASDLPSPLYWYPLHHLARWSGVVAVAAPAIEVKKAMAEAKARIDAACKKEGHTLEHMYKKIGNTICVSEAGFVISVETWCHSRPAHTSLHEFATDLASRVQTVFHSPLASSTTSTAPSHAALAAAVPIPTLIAKYAFDAQHAPAGSLASASLAASAADFSLASFLDQHLQAPTAASRPADSERDLECTRAELARLRTFWQTELDAASRTHPQAIADEAARVRLHHAQLTSLTAQHDETRRKLASHVAASQAMQSQVGTLQRNLAFIQHVQLYEQALRRAQDLSDRCRDELSGAPAATAPGVQNTQSGQAAVSNPTLDAAHVQSICVMFLKLMRLYRGLQESTRVHVADAQLSGGQSAAADDTEAAATSPATSWVGVSHLQRMLRQRILTIFQPLKSKLIQLYQQTLLALNWPQTTTTLLLGMRAIATHTAAGSPPTSSSSAALSPSPPPLDDDAPLRLFELLTENLVRIQMLLVECGLQDEVRAVEREIQGVRADRKPTTHAEEVAAEKRRKAPCRLWVLSLLLQPIYKRFYYHFDSSTHAAHASSSPSSSSTPSDASSIGGSLGSQTNRLDKPEWVCTFLEKAYTDHKPFLESIVQPVVRACRWRKEYERANATVASAGGVVAEPPPYEFSLEFLERLLGFYHAKLSRPSVMHAITTDPYLLRHTLHELISFESKLSSVHSYPVGSSRRLSLLEPFLRGDAFQSVLKAEKDQVNRGLDQLRELAQPWESVTRGHAADNDSGDERDEEEDAQTTTDIAANSLDATPFLLGSSSLATVSSHTFLSLIDRLTSRYRSFKYLNLRLHILKEVQFKLFEIYEEDLIRAFQHNWARITESVRNGGIAKLAPDQRRVREEEDDDDAPWQTAPTKGPANPLPLWRTHCGLLNSISYIVAILRDWNDEVIFLELYYFYTHKSRIQSSMLAAHHQLAQSGGGGCDVPYGAATPIGGVIVHQAEEEEVLITSEELALWMANGGKATYDDADATATATTTTSTTADPTPAAIGASPITPAAATSYLPEEFQETVKQLSALSRLCSDRLGSALDGTPAPLSFEWLPGSSATSVTASNGAPSSSFTPTSAQLFPKSPVEPSSGTSAGASRARVASAAVPIASSLPVELSISGTLFEPILASYNSLREEMMHALVNVCVNHFREGIRRVYAQQGHMSRTHTENAAAFHHPAIRQFFHPVDDEDDEDDSVAVSPLSSHAIDWDLLDQHVDISSALCQPILELKMQLIVVKNALNKSLHRSFWSSVASKLSQVMYDDLVAGQYFTRSGSLQFIRDMRAVFALFDIYARSSARSGGSSRANSHFKLVQDVINILMLSPRQVRALESQLTAGAVAASSTSTVRAFLARPPYAVQKLSAAQVVDLLVHMRTDTEDRERREQEVQDGAHASPHAVPPADDDAEEDAEDEEDVVAEAAEAPSADDSDAAHLQYGDVTAASSSPSSSLPAIVTAAADAAPPSGRDSPLDDEPNMDDFDGFPDVDETEDNEDDDQEAPAVPM